MSESWRQGRPVTLPHARTIADGVAAALYHRFDDGLLATVATGNNFSAE